MPTLSLPTIPHPFTWSFIAVCCPKTNIVCAAISRSRTGHGEEYNFALSREYEYKASHFSIHEKDFKKLMGFSNWLYTDSRKNLRVKIVHPGGHAELHETPVLAAEIIKRNPKCCVAHPNVFKQPWAIVQPDTMLMPGQKFYLVPITTIRKLQMMSIKLKNSSTNSQIEEEVDQTSQSSKPEDASESPCWFISSSTPTCLESSGDKNGSSSCFTCMTKGKKHKDSSKSSDNWESSKKRLSVDYWQPGLKSVNEE